MGKLKERNMGDKAAMIARVIFEFLVAAALGTFWFYGNSDHWMNLDTPEWLIWGFGIAFYGIGWFGELFHLFEIVNETRILGKVCCDLFDWERPKVLTAFHFAGLLLALLALLELTTLGWGPDIARSVTIIFTVTVELFMYLTLHDVLHVDTKKFEEAKYEAGNEHEKDAVAIEGQGKKYVF